MSKQAVGIYSSEYVEGHVFADSKATAAKIAAQKSPGQTTSPNGPSRMESYIVQHKRGEPTGAVVIGALEDGTRFYAKLHEASGQALAALADGKRDGAKLNVTAAMPANTARLV